MSLYQPLGLFYATNIMKRGQFRGLSGEVKTPKRTSIRFQIYWISTCKCADFQLTATYLRTKETNPLPRTSSLENIVELLLALKKKRNLITCLRKRNNKLNRNYAYNLLNIALQIQNAKNVTPIQQ
jgi:hypothetical protein